jgi:uncharacterized protein (DUF1015 family)
MATIKPFAALRPDPELAGSICELPYDVMSSAEARALAAGNPLSFLHVSKPEIDLPLETDLYDPAVYAKGKENFSQLLAEGALRQDTRPCFYLYRLIMGAHQQTGLVAVASCEEYLAGTIKKHEFTRPDKEDDRVRHIETLDAQTGPVFLVYRAVAELDQLVKTKLSEAPQIDFRAKDGVRHSAWVIKFPGEIDAIEEAFARIPALYIADGHHRSAAATRVYQQRKGAGGSGWFLAVIFPHDQVQILPYNRVLRDLNGHSEAALLKKLGDIFSIHEDASPEARQRGELGFYIGGKWRTLAFRPELTVSASPVEQLDVARLQKLVLGPVFGIDDPRTSKRIHFVGGIRGPAELERLVNNGEGACAFSMFPTGIDELMAIADAGGVMPPKSTWFEPKLRDGMFSHLI